MSDALFNGSVGHSVLAMITSAKQSSWLLDVAIADLAPVYIYYHAFKEDAALQAQQQWGYAKWLFEHR